MSDTHDFPQLNWLRDVSPADWLSRSLPAGRWGYVDSLLPRCFESYARILHPAWRSGPEEEAARWEEVASQTGRVMHPNVQFDAIVRPARAGRRWRGRRPVPSLSPDQVSVLVELLANRIGHARCYFCIWDGYGWPLPPEQPLVKTPGRDYMLYDGDVSTAAELLQWPWEQSPNIWWPESREWCIATDIDLDSTYIGGPADLIAEVLEDDRLETFPAHPDDSVTVDSDTINLHGN